ncbi:MAG: Ig-like domain-containing protein [Gemmatimonadetes bacterium]|nr:Ig-like domain-containing protein [Gemmatimonadota bacterium]
MRTRRPLSRILTSLAALSSVVLATCEKVTTAPGGGGTGTAGNASIAIDSTSGFPIVISGTDTTVSLPISTAVVDPTISASAAGIPIQNPSYRLITSDESVVKVSDAGTGIIVKKRGAAFVTALLLAATSSSGAAPQIRVKILARTTSVVAPNPTAVMATIGDTAQLKAAAYGTTVTSADSIVNPGFSWTSSNPAVATVNSNGQLVAVSNGPATITVTSDTAKATINVTVKQQVGKWSTSVDTITLSAFGDTGTVTATMRDWRSNLVNPAVTDATPSWTADDTTIVRLLPAGKTVRLVALKNSSSPLVTLTASYVTTDTTVIRVLGGTNVVRKVVAVRVAQAAAQVIAITPPAIALRAIGDSLIMQVRLLDKNGSDLDLTKLPPNWSASNPTVASVNANGVVKAFAVGTTNIIAQRDTAVRVFALTVTNDPDTVRFLNPGRDTTFTSFGDSVFFTTTVRNRLGTALPGAALTWQSLDATIATVTPAGKVKAVGTGSTTIIATATGFTVSASRVVTVRNDVTGITFGAPRSLTMASFGDTVTPPVDIRNARGDVLDRTTVAWTSADPLIASVSPTTGIVTAVGRGTVFIRGVAGNSRDSIPVTVSNAPATITITAPVTSFTALPDTIRFSATARNARGDTLADPISWISTNASVIGTVNNGKGAVIAVGTTTITASTTVGGVTKSASQVVTATNTVTRVVLGLHSVTLPSVGRVQALSVSAQNSAGGPVVVPSFTWTSTDATRASVSSSGVVTGLAPGATNVIVSFLGVADTAIVSVNNAPDTVRLVTTDTTMTAVGDAFLPGVNFKDAAGNALGRNTVTWSTSNPAIATVVNDPATPAGRITANDTGQVQITATSPAAAGSFDTLRVRSFLVTVRNNPAAVTLDRSNDTLTARTKTIQYTADVRNSNGKVIPLAATTQVAFSSSTPAIVSINAGTGLATANDTGNVTITVSTTTPGAPIKTATAFLRVTNKAAAVSVSPTPVTISGAVRTQLLTATATNVLGAAIASPVVTWTTSNALVATVTTGGLVTGLANGTATITATVDGVGQGVPVTVMAGAAAPGSSTISVSAPTVTADGVSSSTITVQLKDASGNNITSGTNTVTLSRTGVGTLGTVGGGNGTYTATITSTTASAVPTVISGTVDGNPITSGTASVTFVPGAASPGQSTISVSTSTPTAGGTAVTITVQAKDALGNNRSTAGDNVAITRSGVGTIAAATGTTNSSGVYTTTISSTATGSSTIGATLNSAPITTGDRTVTFAPGAAAAVVVTTDPAGASSGSNFTTQPVVRIVDGNGNTVTSSTATVVASIASGSGAVLGGTTSVAAVGGVATFSNLKLTGASGSFTIGFASAPLTAATSGTIVLGPGLPASIAVTTAPSGAVNGVNFTGQPVVRIVDASGNTVTSSTAAVTASISSGTGATLSGNLSVNAVAGVATFTNLRLTGLVGTFGLDFTTSGATSATSGTFALAPGAAVAAAITTQPSGASSGSDLTGQPVVRIVDASGNTVTGSSVSVVAAIASGSGAVLSGTTSVAASAGVATFTNLRLTGTVGNFTLGFTPTALTGATSGTVVLAPGTASALFISTAPAGAASGAAFTTQPVVQVRDASGNVVTGSAASIAVSVASGGATLSGATPVTATGGVATFSGLTLTGATGAHTLSFTSAPLTPATSGSFALAAGSASALVITASPPGTVANDAALGTVSVRLRDGGGNNVLAAGTSVTASIATGGGALMGTVTKVTDASGVADFTDLRIRGTLGNRTLTFSASGLTAATSGTVNVNVAGAPNQLVVTQQATASPAVGAPFAQQPKVQLSDVSGNAILTSGVPVTASIFSGATGLTGTLTVNTDVGGVANFGDLGITGVIGVRTLLFTQAALTVQSGTITMVAGAPASLAFTTAPTASATNGSNLPTQPVINALDAGGNVATGFSGTMTATISAGTGGTLINPSVGITAGVATYTSLRLQGTAGAFTLQFSDGTRTVSTVSITLAVGPAASVAFDATGTPGAAATNGTNLPTQPKVNVLDVGGNVVTTASGTMTATIFSGPAGSLVNATATIASGVATFSGFQLNGPSGAGTYVLRFSDGTRTVNSGAITLAVGAAASVVFDATGTPGAAATNGVNLSTQPIVKVVDVGGNTVTSASGTMTATIFSGTGGTLVNPTATITSGVATFSGLQLNGTPGAFVLRFSDGTRTVNSTSITLAVGAAAAVAFDASGTPGAAATNGVNLSTQPIVKVVDAGGNTVTSASGTMTATIFSGTGGTLVNPTATIASGVATFSALRLNGTAGTFVLRFSDGTRTVNSVSITLAVGAAAAVAITTQPDGAVNGVDLTQQPVVRIVDVGGNTVTSSSASVDATIASGGGALQGTTSVSAIAGVATFTTLRVNGSSSAKTLQFASTGLTPVTSAPFTPGVGAAAAVVFDATGTPGATATNGTNLPTQPKVNVVDAGGNIVTTASGTMTATIFSGAGGTLVNATATITSGVATFSGFQLNGTAGTFVLQFSDGTRTVNSTSITLGVGAASAVEFDAAGTPGASATNGTNLPTQPIVKVVDVGGNTVTSASGTMTATIFSGTGGTLVNPTATITSGVATFSGFRLNGTAGAFVLRFSDGTRTVNSVSITLGVGAAASLAFDAGGTPGATTTNGTDLPTQPVVNTLDVGGNLVTGASGTMTATIFSGSGGSISGTTTASITAGVATFTTLRLNGLTSQSYVLRFSDGTRTLNSSAITPSLGAAAAVAFDAAGTPGATATNGTDLPTQPIVNVVDAGGNTIAAATGTMTATVNTGTGGVLVNATATITAGVATFSGFRLNGTAGNFTLNFSDGTFTVTSGTIALAAGTSTAVVFDAAGTPGATATNGVNLSPQPKVKVVDVSGNTVTTASGTMTATIKTGSGGTLVNATAPITSGVATFSGFQLNGTAGNFTLDFGNGTFTVTSGTIALGAGAAASLAFDAAGTPGATATNGTNLPTQPIVNVLDVGGNIATGASGTMTATIFSGTGGTLVSATATITAGVATFSGFQLNGTAGAFVLRFSDGTRTLNSVSITLAKGAAFAINKILGDGQAVVAGGTYSDSVKVRVVDVGGNALSGVAVDFTTSNGTATPIAAATDVNGLVATQWMPGTVAGAVSLTASTTAGSAPSTGFAGSVTHAAADHLVMFVQPSATASDGVPLATQPKVRIADQYGNTVTTGASASASMTVTYNPTGGSTLAGTATVAAVGGIATYSGLIVNLAAATADTGTLSFAVSGLTGVTSSSIATSP